MRIFFLFLAMVALAVVANLPLKTGAVIIVSAVVLSEPIGTSQWIGIMLIATGIALVGWSQN